MIVDVGQRFMEIALVRMGLILLQQVLMELVQAGLTDHQRQ